MPQSISCRWSCGRRSGPPATTFASARRVRTRLPSVWAAWNADTLTAAAAARIDAAGRRFTRPCSVILLDDAAVGAAMHKTTAQLTGWLYRFVERTKADQARADIFADLLTESPDVADVTGTHIVSTMFKITIPLSSLMGFSDQPAELTDRTASIPPWIITQGLKDHPACSTASTPTTSATS